MPSYEIGGITVDFPYKAYDLQIRYMEKVIEALQKKQHALLESPTGTGKTLCLLCASLAWRQHQLAVSVVIPTTPISRTLLDEVQATLGHKGAIIGEHQIPSNRVLFQDTQPAQSSDERGQENGVQVRTGIGVGVRFLSRVKTTVLGSREQQCSNPELKDTHGSSKNNACLKLVKSKRCQWHGRLEEYDSTPSLSSHASRVMDVEDLSALARSSGPCVYFFTRRLAEISDLVFLPYNYLIDKQTRQGIESLFNWKDSIVIFDEAHNIEQCCSDAASFDLSLTVLSNSRLELQKGIRICSRLASEQGAHMRRPTRTQSWQTLHTRSGTLINMIDSLESLLNGLELPSSGEKAYPAQFMFELLSKACISDLSWKVLVDVLRDVSEVLTDGLNSSSGDQQISSSLNGSSCSVLADALEKVFDSQDPVLQKAFRVFVKRERSRSGMQKLTLSYWCFSPGVAMKSFVQSCGIQSVILTSGTLAPLDSFASELNLLFPTQLENEHIVTKEQVLIGCVPTGPTNCVLDSSFKHREDPKYKEDLGLAVIHFARVIPGGVLMFFPSYSVLQSTTEYWKTCKRDGVTLWQRITQLKGVVLEPQNPGLLPAVMKDYHQKLTQSVIKGCILFAVCRGKVSEGIDFSDETARGVIIAGIPYAPHMDPKVRLKREFLDGMRGGLTGSRWYKQAATRAVNQALGRVIRHRDDYGVILLCDRRLGENTTQMQLSKWVRNAVTPYDKFDGVIKDLKCFFQSPRKKGISSEESKEWKVVESTSSGVPKRSTVPEEEEEVGVCSAKKRQKKEEVFIEIVDLPQELETTIDGNQVEENKTKEGGDQRSITEDSIPEKEVVFSQDPREFMMQIKEMLPEKVYTEFRQLLSDLKSTLDVDGFQDSLIQLLSGEDNRQLLPGFAFFIPETRRKAFLERIKKAQND